MTDYEISYNLGTPRKVRFTVNEGKDIYTNLLARLEQEGLTIPQIVNETAVILKNLTTGERYKLSQTGTGLEKMN